MAGDPKPPAPGPPEDAGAGWTALAYLISGMLVWGGVGWALDRWWLHSGGIAIAVGLVLGMAGAVYLIARRLGR
jgi:F0F1-type ATP synthase assembly protein I